MKSHNRSFPSRPRPKSSRGGSPKSSLGWVGRAISLFAYSPAARSEMLYYAFVALLTLAYLLLIIWSALVIDTSAFSFKNLDQAWRTLRYTFSGARPLDRDFIGDMVANWLLYFPFGMLVALVLLRFTTRNGRTLALRWALAAGPFLSLSMESAQMFLRHRNPDWADWLTNSFGYLCGFGTALLARETAAAPVALSRERRYGVNVLGLLALMAILGVLFRNWFSVLALGHLTSRLRYFLRGLSVHQAHSIFHWRTLEGWRSLAIQFGFFALAILLLAAWIRIRFWESPRPVQSLLIVFGMLGFCVFVAPAAFLKGPLGNPTHALLTVLFAGVLGICLGYLLTAFPGADAERRKN